MRRLLLALSIATLYTPACKGSDDDSDGNTDTGTKDTGTYDGGVADTGVPDSGVRDTGVRDSGVEEAIVVEVGDPYGEAEAIDPPGDVDLFQFTATAGQWVRIITRSGGSPVDPVITLFDADMNQIAENDDEIVVPHITDSEINFHVPADGTYFVRVQEYSTWAGETPVGGPEFTYSLRAPLWDDATSGVVVDPENGDDAASAVQDELGVILGTFRDADDVDVYRIRVASSTTVDYSVDILPAGTTGQGSTSPAGKVWLTDLANTQTIAAVDQSVGNDSLGPPVNPGEYLMWIAHPATAVGANDFYVLKPRLFVENPLERGEPNNTLATAEALAEAVSGTVRQSFILARLSGTDVDYFSFEIRMNEAVSVACGAESSGSGVRGLSVELRDRGDAVLVSDEEGPTGALIQSFVPTSTGTLYLRLSAGTPAADVTSRFVRCGLQAFIPTP